MNLLKANELRVGAMVMTIVGLIGYMSMRVSDDVNLFSTPNEAYFILPDAAGLVKGSAVKMAGIPVGTIQDISLQDGQARIDINIRPDIPMYQSAKVDLKTQGILGDRYVEIYPGSPTDPPLGENGQILSIASKGSIDALVNQFADVGATINDISKVLKDSLSGDGTREHSIGRIINNIEKLTEDLSQVSSANKGKLNDIVDQVNRITATIDELVNEEGENGFKSQWNRALARIDSSLKNIDEITEKINKGEGTIGKLINDDTTVEEINTAVSGINSFLNAADKVQTGIDFHSDYLFNIGASKTSIGLTIQPGVDRFYLISVVDDPAGLVDETESKITNQDGSVSITKEEKTYKNRVKFTALFGKHFYDFTIRGGLIENSGGVGFDYRLFRKKLILSLEAFEFESLNLRLQARLNVYKGIYLTAGVSDALNKGSKYSNYLGAGLFLTNDDLKLLLTKSPF